MKSISYTGNVIEDVVVGDVGEHDERWQVELEQCQPSDLKKSHQVHLRRAFAVAIP